MRIIKRISKEEFADFLYLIGLTLYLVYVFFETTMVEFVWPEYLYSDIKLILFIGVLLRMFLSKNAKWQEVILIVLVSGVLLFAQSRNEFEILGITVLLLLGARGLAFKKIAGYYLVIEAVLLVYTVGSALIGNTENLIYYQEGRRARIAFGSVYPTDFSAHVFYLILIYYYLRGRYIKYVELIAGIAGAAFVYVFCDARLNTVCILITVVAFWFNKFLFIKAGKQSKEYIFPAFLSYFLAMMPVLCSGFMVIASMLYSPDNKILFFLNRLLNNRLSQGFKGIDIYGFSVWGQSIPMQGNGGSTEMPMRYFFLDSSYLSIVLQYGFVVFGIILLIWICISFRAREEQNWELLLAVAIISVQCMIEHHMLEAAYLPFMWAVFANAGVIQRNVRIINGWKKYVKKTV